MTTRTVGVGQTYTTIASAVAAAVSGDTISILAGTYQENLILPANKKLKLSGASKDTTIIDCTNAVVGTVNPSKYCAIYISATTASTTDTTSGIEVENLTLIGKESPAGTETGTLYISGRHGFVKIHDCIITAAGEYAIFVDPGVTINAGGILDIYNNTINGQTYKGTTTPVQTWTGTYFSQQFSVQNIPRQLVMVYGNYTAAGTTAYVRNNTLTGSTGANDTNGIYHSNTVMTCDAGNVTISGNTFSVECKPLLSGNVALRARGNNCVVSNNTFIDPINNGYILDNKTLSGTNGTNNVTYTINTITIPEAKSNYTLEYTLYNNSTTLPKTIPVGFVRNAWKLTKGSTILYLIGLGKIQFSDITTLLSAEGTSGSYSSIDAALLLASDGNEIIADNAIVAPTTITKNVAIRSASTAYIYNSNAFLSYDLASNSHIIRLMQNAVQAGIPNTSINASKVSSGSYTELVKIPANYGVVTGGIRAREVVAELELLNQPFGSFLLDAKVATSVTSTAPSFTAAGNIYVQEDTYTDSVTGNLKYAFKSGFSNANATKRAVTFRVSNTLTYAIEVLFDDYNVPTTQSIKRTLQPGDHMFFLSRTVGAVGGSATGIISWKPVGSTSAGTGNTKAANANLLNWDNSVTKVDILTKTLYVSGSGDSLALGIVPAQITGTVNLVAMPTGTTVDITSSLGLTSSNITVSSTSLNIPDSAAGQINTVALSSAVTVAAGQQLSDAVGDSRVILAKPASDAATTIPVRALPNDSASTQLASIEVPAGGSQVAVEVKPNGVIATSGAIKIKSPTSSPIMVIDLITGIAYTGTDIDIGSGNFGSFTQPTRVQVVSF